MKYDLAKLVQGIRDLDMDVSEDQLLQFDRYISLLLEWNNKMNLTAIVEPREIIVEHFLDSVSLLKAMNRGEDHYSLIDVGTGAGFPGIPIKIMEPSIDLLLLDSLKKRVEYLKIVKDELNLKNTKVIHSRAEDLAGEANYREKFDIAVSRAVAPLNVLSEYCMPFVKIGGFFISYKGPAAEAELLSAQKAIQVLGGEGTPKVKNALVPFSPKTHNLIFIQKQTPTPKKYPRSPGKIKKSPL